MRNPLAPSRFGYRFNMTPMIDVILQLLIFFLCVHQFQKAERDESVVLPQAASPKVATPNEEQHSPLVFNVRAGEAVFVAGKRLGPNDFARVLEQHRQGDAELEVWIRADRQAVYGMVEPLLLACARAGVWKVAFKVLTPEQAEMGKNP
jgi:biopolymer transport protein ExbD